MTMVVARDLAAAAVVAVAVKDNMLGIRSQEGR